MKRLLEFILSKNTTGFKYKLRWVTKEVEATIPELVEQLRAIAASLEKRDFIGE